MPRFVAVYQQRVHCDADLGVMIHYTLLRGAAIRVVMSLQVQVFHFLPLLSLHHLSLECGSVRNDCLHPFHHMRRSRFNDPL